MNTTVFDRVLLEVADWLLLGSACWGALLCVAALVESATAGRVRATAWLGCPPQVRRALLAALGVALAGGGPAAPALATACPSASRGSHTGRHAALPTGAAGELPVPSRPVGGLTTPRHTRTVVVRPGDSLWRLVRERAGPEPTPSEVAVLVARAHQRNRALIGPDPDVLHPGQRLVLPVRRHHPTDRSHEETP